MSQRVNRTVQDFSPLILYDASWYEGGLDGDQMSGDYSFESTFTVSGTMRAKATFTFSGTGASTLA